MLFFTCKHQKLLFILAKAKSWSALNCYFYHFWISFNLLVHVFCTSRVGFVQEMEHKKQCQQKLTDWPTLFSKGLLYTFFCFCFCLFVSVFCLMVRCLACSTQIYGPHEAHAMLQVVGYAAFYSISLPFTVRAPVFGRHQFFGTSEQYGKAHGRSLSG